MYSTLRQILYMKVVQVFPECFIIITESMNSQIKCGEVFLIITGLQCGVEILIKIILFVNGSLFRFMKNLTRPAVAPYAGVKSSRLLGIVVYTIDL